MLLYILKSTACLTILLVFYKIFLENENMHSFKRFYLLVALLAAYGIPFITLIEYIELPEVNKVIGDSTTIDSMVYSIKPIKHPIDFLPGILWSIYTLGTIIFGFKFFKNLSRIIQRIRKNPKLRINRITKVLLRDSIIPHTFFNYIFLNKQKFEAKEIPTEVILHEETHAKQKHSLDVLFIEFFQVIFWFNPLLYMAKKAIKLNHEFLADREVMRKGIKLSKYQNILLEFSSNSHQPVPIAVGMANAINYSSIKKRFTVMKTETSKKSFLIRSFLVLTLLTTLVYGFSQKKILEIKPENKQEILGSWIDEEQESTELSIIKLDGNLMSAHVDSKVFRLQEINGEYYYFSLYEKTKHPVLIDRKKGTITLANREYVRKEKSLKGKLYGNWENKKEGIKFNVHHGGNEIVWDVIKAYGKPIRYYPKKQDGRYGFTYGKELWSFTVENDVLYDSKGFEYHRISKNIKQKGATKEQIAEFNALAKKYNLMLYEGGNIRILGADVERLEYLYGIMTKEQRANAEPFPDFPEPPSPPKAPKEPNGPSVKKGKKSNLPPPPSVSNVSEVAFAEKVIDEIIAHQDPYDLSPMAPKVLKGEIGTIPPTSPVYELKTARELKEIREEIQGVKYIKGEVDTDLIEPPAPPEPISPLDHVIKMAKKDATFYYEGKEISSDKAIAILKKNKKINLRTRHEGLKKPIVELSTKPVIIKK